MTRRTRLPSAEQCRATVAYAYQPTPEKLASMTEEAIAALTGRLRCNRPRRHDVTVHPHETVDPATGKPYQFTHPADARRLA